MTDDPLHAAHRPPPRLTKTAVIASCLAFCVVACGESPTAPSSVFDGQWVGTLAETIGPTEVSGPVAQMTLEVRGQGAGNWTIRYTDAQRNDSGTVVGVVIVEANK